MIPGLSSAAEAQLAAVLVPAVTALTPPHYAALDTTILTPADAARLGIVLSGIHEPTLVVTDPGRPIGRVNLECAGRDALVFVDNRAGALHGSLRILGDDCAVIVHAPPGNLIGAPNWFLRSHGQFLFWGPGATAVECTIEIEGDGHGVVIGDDALIASGVWIRNHDMHALHDLATGTLLSRPPVTTIVERHVWLGQDALLLSCERIGTGSVVGARSMVKGTLPPRVAAAGVPARILRQGVSWGRDRMGMTEAERALVAT